jgi:hypothetical protein
MLHATAPLTNIVPKDNTTFKNVWLKQFPYSAVDNSPSHLGKVFVPVVLTL